MDFREMDKTALAYHPPDIETKAQLLNFLEKNVIHHEPG